jgi:mycoredoxin
MQATRERNWLSRCYRTRKFPDSRRHLVSGQLTMYTTTWCGFCRNLKNQLARDGIEMAEIDIERDQAAAEYVMSVNGGNQTVPTVVFPDGTAMTNPSAKQVKAKLAEIETAGPVARG